MTVPPHSANLPQQPFQPPAGGQPFQPPAPGQPPFQQQPAMFGQAPVGQQPPTPPAATSGRPPFWPFAVGALAVVVLGASFWMGSFLAVYSRTGLGFYLLIALVGGSAGGLLAVWSNTATQVQIWGSELYAKTALGWQRVELAHLTSAAVSAWGQRKSVVLDDGHGRISVGADKLAPISDGLRRGLFEAAQQGRLVVPNELAKLLGAPLQPGARRLGKSGNMTRVFSVFALICAGLIAGASISS